ncbi:MAG TPA: pentapeptide repeat-containing protein [Acidobacteriota bacterium]|nr:pentapeptide repeat-containing protein [Acidobacteriota bacterium]
MANPEHVAELMKGVESWNKWIEEQRKFNPVFRADLEDIDLQKEKIEGSNLQNSDFLSGGANLRGALLQRVNLRGAKLQDAVLWGAQLQGANLYNANLERAQLWGANLQGADCGLVQFREALLINVRIESSNFEIAFLDDADLYIESLDTETSFSGTRFYKCQVSIDDEVDQRAAVKVLAQGRVNYVQFTDPVFGRKVRDQAWLNKWLENIEQLKSKHRWQYLGMTVWAWFWRQSSDYGRSIGRWIVWSVFIVVSFALLYKFSPESLHYNHPASVTRFTPLYFSSVIFTTLGFGDISPKTLWFEIWVTLEVILGYIMLGGLISIFATKIARRND